MQDDTRPAVPEPEDPGAVEEAGLFGRAINAGGIVFSLAILASALILFYEVLMRYLFNSPTLWAHETVIFITGCAFIYGGLYVVARDAHIRVVLIYDYLPKALRRVFDVVISIACLVATLFFAWAAWQSVQRAAWNPAGDFRLQSSGSAWDPVYPGLTKVFLMIVLLMMVVQFAILTVNYLRKFFR